MGNEENVTEGNRMKFPFIEHTKHIAGTVKEESLFKRLPTIAIFSLFLAMGSAVWGITQSFVSYRIEENNKLITSHTEDREKHMSMERKMQLFVLRQEYEKDIKEINVKLETILEKLDNLRGVQ